MAIQFVALSALRCWSIANAQTWQHLCVWNIQPVPERCWDGCVIVRSWRIRSEYHSLLNPSLGQDTEAVEAESLLAGMSGGVAPHGGIT